ncbi:MAG: hypothetical protein KHZ90_09610 [Veillonella parvula]|uniref:Uncharacterized protein n=1 Tax=Veillonella parvula TaxID=29466 RepID=A0A943A732_VEIPA|nr:hypothetical protein [Veillonella parvula]MBS4894011.1 hypothetical protein [Veillonella parvula]
MNTEKIKELYRNYYWKMRVKRHKRWEFVSRFLIKRLALALLKRSSMYYNHIERHKTPPKIKTFDKAQESKLYHKVCGEYKKDINHYSKSMSVAEYTFYGNTDYEIYTQLIYKITLRPTCYPYCTKGGLIGVINRRVKKNK